MALLSELFNLQMGKTPARANSNYWEEGTNSWVSIADLSNYEKYTGETKEKITDLAVQESGIKAVPPNTVIMSFKLSLGKTAITRKATYTNEAIMAFISKNTCDILPDYLFYMLSSKDWSKGINRAVMGATLNKATIGEINVEIPPLDRQLYVATILDKISVLISLRKQQISKLDELVKARFVEMFGDISETVPLSHYISALSAGKSLAGETECINKVLKTGAATYDEFDPTQVKNLPIDYVPQADHLLKTGDVIISRMNTAELVGATAYVWKAPINTYLPDRLWRAELKKSVCPIFVWQSLIQIETKESIRKIASGTSGSMKNISKTGLLMIHIKKVEYDNQQKFSNFVEQIHGQKLTIQQSLDKLEVLKKSLMQEYFG